MHQRTPVLAALVQEHRMTRARAATAHEDARQRGILLLINYLPDGQAAGGVLILIPHTSIETRGNESFHEAVSRIQTSVHTSQDGRLITARTFFNGELITLASAYAPQDGQARVTFFNTFTRHLDKRTVLGIDANCVPDDDLDLKRDAASVYDNRGSNELTNAVSSLDLTDMLRDAKEDEPFFSKATRVNIQPERITYTRIDQLYSPHIDGMIWTHKDQADTLRDVGKWGHRMLRVDVNAIREERGRDLEHISELIFDDPAFNACLARAIRDAEDNWALANGGTVPNGDWPTLWAHMKDVASTLCLEETKRKRRVTTASERFLVDQILAYQKAVDSGTADASAYTDLQDAKRKLATERKRNYSLYTTLEKEAYDMGKKHEVSSAAFYRQWTPRNDAQWIQEIIEADWTDPSAPQVTGRCTRAADIARHVTPYYRSLFAGKQISQPCKNACRRALQQGKQVLGPTAARCGADITRDDVLYTCARLPTGKSPGPDRLPNKFYRVLSEVIATPLTNAINESRQRGWLPSGMSDGLISLLYKKNVRDDPRNYRPITLLNGDYKIMMRILTQRMNEAVVQFVSDDQNGFVPNAFIAENTMRLKLIQAYIEDQDEEALFVFLDMEKAFDRCSWEFLIDGLRDLGFGQGFIDYVTLAYSHAHAPERQLYVNGYLGPRFPLGSGVAQGCPLSPLLFLIITEPLSRMIRNDAGIRGVNIGGVAHKLSQFADDSALIARPRDMPRFSVILRIWCRGTAMRENESKREGLLLGRLRRHPERAPTGIVAGDRWARDGETIRALGVPFGNRVNELAWWTKRYKIVKRRVACWHAVGRMGLVGRNMLLQSILYGSMRYWFFSLVVPEPIIDAMESDAKNLLWAQTPQLQTDEVGTSAASRRYMLEYVSYKPQRQGGGGIMHLRSHITAFQSQWVIAYLLPRDAPWKHIVDEWVGDRSQLGRGVILSSAQTDYSSKVPKQAKYLKACLDAFAKLRVLQDTSLLSHMSQGEPLHRNNRFTMTLPAEAKAEWSKHLATRRLSDLIDAQGRPHTYASWAYWIRRQRRLRGQQWVSDRLSEIHPLMQSPPPIVMQAVAVPAPRPPADGTVLLWRHANGDVDIGAMMQGAIYEMVLDVSGHAHRTGAVLNPGPNATLEELYVWRYKNRHHKSPFAGEDENEGVEELMPEEVLAAVGDPATRAFPLNEGWYMEGQTVRKARDDELYCDDIRRLTDMTIREITQHLTCQLVDPNSGTTVEDLRPNCEQNWYSKIHQHISPHIRIPWMRIWRSLGTPLSDPTEEKAARKLLHRAWNAKNRHPKEPDHSCRLGCGATESMLHMITCPRARPLWKACLKFCRDVLGEKDAPNQYMAVVFGTVGPDELMSESGLAFMRHALSKYYRDATLIHTKKFRIHWTRTLRDALLSYRDAVMRYAYAMRRMYANRLYTNLVEVVPEKDRDRFPRLIEISQTGTFKLTQAFSTAVDKAVKTVDQYGHPGHHRYG